MVSSLELEAGAYIVIARINGPLVKAHTTTGISVTGGDYLGDNIRYTTLSGNAPGMEYTRILNISKETIIKLYVRANNEYEITDASSYQAIRIA